MRSIFYKVKLIMTNNTDLVITVATPYVDKLPELITNKAALYNRPGEYKIARFEVVDVRYTVNMPEQQYQNELSFCDIVDLNDVDWMVKPEEIQFVKKIQ